MVATTSLVLYAREGLPTKRRPRPLSLLVSWGSDKPAVLGPTERRPFAGGELRAACANNDDDAANLVECPSMDEKYWCERAHFTGPNSTFSKVGCKVACEDADLAWAMVCAWQAVAHLSEICDKGHFTPVSPQSLSANSPNDPDAPTTAVTSSGAVLYPCDTHAVCQSCFGGGAATAEGGEQCERVAAHYGGFGLIDDAELDGETGADAAFRVLFNLDEWCASLDPFKEMWEESAFGFVPALVESFEDGLFINRAEGAEYVQKWGTPGTEPVEEHVIRDVLHNRERFSKDAYSLWRYWLVRPDRHDGELHVHTTELSLQKALEENRVSEGAVIFVDFLYAMIDMQHFAGNGTLEDALGDPTLVASALRSPPCQARARYCQKVVNRECVYQFTDNLVLRSSTLRALLSYERPLTIVLAGDLSCRLAGDLPVTHHKLLIANDAAEAMVQEYNARRQDDRLPRAAWFPFGLEGVQVRADPTASPLDADSSGAAIRAQAPLPVAQRTYYITLSASLNRRKPSRNALLAWLDSGRGFYALEAHRRAAAPSLVNSFVFNDERPEPLYGRRWQFGADALDDGADLIRKSVFAVAPAGDFWTSGRILESMMLGAIPVVDATYASDDGLSAKNCDDPARFWRDGSPEFPHRAPVVFVQDWARLPDILDEFVANSTLEQLVHNLAAYVADLQDHLRSLPLNLRRRIDNDEAPPPTACAEHALDKDERERLIQAARDYYATDWYNYYADSAGMPGIGCSKFPEILVRWPESGAQCFSSDCTPPLVADFDCSLV